MLYDLYMFEHNVLHICFWTLPAIIVGVVMIVTVIVHKRNHQKREEEFNEQLEEKINSLAFMKPKEEAQNVANAADA